MRRPKADTVEVFEVVPWCVFMVSGAFSIYWAWRGWLPGVRGGTAIAALSVVAAGATHVWRAQLEAAELNAARAAQRARRHHMPAGRSTVTVPLPDHH